MYGFNAFDGVINIITKSPEEMKGTTLQFGGGEQGTISSAAVHAGTVGKFGYRLSIGRDQTQQWRDGDALAFRAHKFNLQTDYALSSTSKLQLVRRTSRNQSVRRASRRGHQQFHSSVIRLRECCL